MAGCSASPGRNEIQMPRAFRDSQPFPGHSTVSGLVMGSVASTAVSFKTSPISHEENQKLVCQAYPDAEHRALSRGVVIEVVCILEHR